MSITDALIFKNSGQYDLEVVERLRLENLGIARITNLENCMSLTDLSLASNSITDLSGLLSAGASLKRLDLSNNKIKSLVPFEHMTVIEHLDLRGNEISSIDELDKLTACFTLNSISFRSADGSETNPICQHPSYNTIVLRKLPQLTILDGGHIGLIDASSALESFIEKLKPDPATQVPLPIDPWWDQRESSVDLSSASVESDITRLVFYEIIYVALLTFLFTLNLYSVCIMNTATAYSDPQPTSTIR